MQMNKNNIIISKVLTIGLLSFILTKVNTTFAACNGSCKIDVSFVGSYLDQTCRLVINKATNNETIYLPAVSTAHLQTAGSEAGAVPFTVEMTECPAQQKVILTFESDGGLIDAQTGNLKNTLGDTMSKDVQVRIRKENGQQLRFNDLSSGQLYALASGKETESHQFTASYYSPSSGTVTPGKLIARAILNINYQ